MKKIGVLTLCVFVIGAVDSIRNFPGGAIYGPHLIFYFIAGGILFLFPVGFVSAYLSIVYKDDGGVYFWIKQTMGKAWAAFAGWCQWANMIIWLPAILAFTGNAFVQIFFPGRGATSLEALVGAIISWWALTLIALFGVRFIARLGALFVTLGFVLPLVVLLVLVSFYVLNGNPITFQTGAFSIHNLLPSFTSFAGWTALVIVMTSFEGIEITGTYINDIRDPGKSFPKAMLLAVAIILPTMIFGSLAIAAIIPLGQLNLASSTFTALRMFLHAFGLGDDAYRLLIIAVAIGLGGALINWVVAPAKTIMQMTHEHYMPLWLIKINRYRIPYRLLIIQAILVSIVCITFISIPSLNTALWFLTAVSLEIYMFMYILLLLSAVLTAWRGKCNKASDRLTKVIGGKWGIIVIGIIGIIGCTLTCVISFVPPATFLESAHIKTLTYLLDFALYLVIALAPFWILLRYRKKYLKAQVN